MKKYLAAYGATLVAVLALDLLWLGLIAQAWYQQGIGHLMATEPKFGIAALFYLVYALGLVVFVVVPTGRGSRPAGWREPLVRGAMFGFFAYATYDLTNWATLRDWPWQVAMVDMLWGATVSSLSAWAGWLAWDKTLA